MTDEHDSQGPVYIVDQGPDPMDLTPVVSGSSSRAGENRYEIHLDTGEDTVEKTVYESDARETIAGLLDQYDMDYELPDDLTELM